MVIELVGLPATGKSTFAKALKEKGKFVLISVRGSKEIFYLNFLFFVRRPVVFLRLLWVTLRFLGPRELWYEKFVNLFLVANAKYEKARSYEYALIDQGYFQNYISLFEKKYPREEYVKLIDLFSRADTIAFFDIAEEERQSRLTRRGYGTRERMSDSYKLEFEKMMQHGAAFLRTLFSPIGNLQERELLPSLVVIRSDEDLREYDSRLHAPVSLLYILNSRMPTEKAHGSQIAKMCEEFGKLGVRTELWFPRVDKNPHRGVSVHQYYDVTHTFETRRLDAFQFIWLREKFPWVGFYLVGLSFLWTLWTTKIPSGTWCYVRKPSIAWILKKKGCHVIYECHEWSRALRFSLFLLRSVDRIVTTNQFIKEEFVKRNFKDGHIIVAPNGVDMSVFGVTETKSEAIKKLARTDFPSDIGRTPILLYTGSLKTMGEDKGVSDIISALQYIPGVYFIAVGGSPEHQEEYRALAKEKGVSDQIFLLPPVSKKDLALFQRVADILLMPFPKRAHYEYFMSPLKTFEYMASGRPIIASSLPSIRMVLSDESAYFTPPDDPVMLSEAIRRVLDDVGGREKKASRAKQEVMNYTWGRRAKRILENLA